MKSHLCTAGSRLRDLVSFSPLATWAMAVVVILLGMALVATRPACAAPGGPTGPPGPKVRPPSHYWPRVEVIFIDEASTRRLGGWPVDRALHARLLNKLVQAGARAVAFDLLFEGPTRAASDAALAQAISRSGRTWLLVDVNRPGGGRPYEPLARAARWRLAHGTLVEGDHFVGGVPLAPFGPQKLPQICIGLLADYLRLPRWPYASEDGHWMFFGSFMLPAKKGAFTADPSDPRRLAIDSESRIGKHSYWKVLNPGYPMGRFQNALVLVGRSAQNHSEELIFDDWSIPAWSFRSHVDALAILLEKMARYLRPIPPQMPGG